MDKINIMYLIGSLGSGGAEKHLIELARGLDKTKYHVYIVIYHPIIHFDTIIDTDDVNVVCIEKRLKFSFIFLHKLVKFIKKNNIDIIHSHMHNTNFWARLAGKLSGCKAVITSIHSTNISKRYYLIEKFLKKWTTRVITVSYLAKQLYLKNLKLNDDGFVTVIQCGIDLNTVINSSKIPPDVLRSKYGIKENDFVIIQIAGIDRNKNQLCLLKAIKSINRNNIKVLLVGRIRDKKYFHELDDYVERNNLREYIIFLGEQKDIFSLLNISDLMVLTSLNEAFPMVLIEAMSMGLPVISSDVGDVRYLVKDNVNGFLFPRDDHKRLAELISNVYSLSSDERKKMGKAGINIIEKNYTIEKMVEKTEIIYQNAILKNVK